MCFIKNHGFATTARPIIFISILPTVLVSACPKDSDKVSNSSGSEKLVELLTFWVPAENGKKIPKNFRLSNFALNDIQTKKYLSCGLAQPQRVSKHNEHLFGHTHWLHFLKLLTFLSFNGAEQM